MMIMLSAFYKDGDLRRRREFLYCLRRNVENEQFEEIHLFIEQARSVERLVIAYPLLVASKVRLIRHGRRVKYRDYFDHANRHLVGRRVAFANADIFFDHTLSLLDNFNLKEKLLCLSRWDVKPDGSVRFFEHPCSQDAWIFEAPIREFFCDFNLGVPGCDNRLAWEADKVGLAISNPSRSLRAYHLHLSQIRRYSEHLRVNGPTKSLPAVFIETPYPTPRGQPPDVPCAGIAFRETMGYVIHRLEPGVSSHSNDPRPFTIIPGPLSKLMFTQVITGSVSPIEVEFLTSGKLYVLVGNDWEGYNSVKAWLTHAGFKEGLPMVNTQCGTGFEVWSLVAKSGERFILPTQAMLVAKRLVKRE